MLTVIISACIAGILSTFCSSDASCQLHRSRMMIAEEERTCSNEAYDSASTSSTLDALRHQPSKGHQTYKLYKRAAIPPTTPLPGPIPVVAHLKATQATLNANRYSLGKLSMEERNHTVEEQRRISDELKRHTALMNEGKALFTDIGSRRILSLQSSIQLCKMRSVNTPQVQSQQSIASYSSMLEPYKIKTRDYKYRLSHHAKVLNEGDQATLAQEAWKMYNSITVAEGWIADVSNDERRNAMQEQAFSAELTSVKASLDFMAQNK